MAMEAGEYTNAMKFADLEYSTRVILKVVLVVLVLAFLWAIREVVAIFMLAIVFASAMDPLADYLHKRKIPRGVSVLALYVVVVGVVGLVISSIIPAVVDQFRLLVTNLPTFLSDFQTKYPSLSGLVGNVNSSEIFQSIIGGTDGGTVFTRTAGVFTGVFAFITVLVISFYLVVADQKGMKELIRPLVPEKNRDMVMSLVHKIQKKMGLWVLGQIILSIAIFVFTYVGLTILNVKYALVLALLAGLLEVVPYMGPILSAVPAFLFALIQSPALAVAVVVLYILIQKSESYILVPKVMQKTVGTSPLVVLLSLLIGVKLAGVLGLILAVPIAGAVMVLLEEFTGDTADQKNVAITE